MANEGNRTFEAVEDALSRAVDLPVFRSRAIGIFSRKMAMRSVDQALMLMRDNYAHLPMKRAMHAVEPVRAIELVRRRVTDLKWLDEDVRIGRPQPGRDRHRHAEFAFHREMLRAFNSVRDLHTHYRLPAPFKRHVAFLPFLIEEYGPPLDRRYVVAHRLDEGDDGQAFTEGVEVTAWSGMPIDRAIETSGDRTAGGNPAARRARGIEYLTIRPLDRSLPPDEDWVEVSFLDGERRPRRKRFHWRVVEIGALKPCIEDSSDLSIATVMGVDAELAFASKLKRSLYAPEFNPKATRRRAIRQSSKSSVTKVDVDPLIKGLVRATIAETDFGPVGHLRIFSFCIKDADAFVEAVAKTLAQMPDQLLLIDVRGNPGGNILAAEGLLRLFSPKVAVEPTTAQFAATDSNLRVCETVDEALDLERWSPSIQQSLSMGGAYSTALPISDSRRINDRNAAFRGSVLCVVDARSYSATDIFAAGIQDNEIGKILGVAENTGAGGANVWTLSLLCSMTVRSWSSSPYLPLYDGDLSFSSRRILRVKRNAGLALEDFGVKPDFFYHMTIDDITNGNDNLIKAAAKILHELRLK